MPVILCLHCEMNLVLMPWEYLGILGSVGIASCRILELIVAISNL